MLPYNDQIWNCDHSHKCGLSFLMCLCLTDIQTSKTSIWRHHCLVEVWRSEINIDYRQIQVYRSLELTLVVTKAKMNIMSCPQAFFLFQQISQLWDLTFLTDKPNWLMPLGVVCSHSAKSWTHVHVWHDWCPGQLKKQSEVFNLKYLMGSFEFCSCIRLGQKGVQSPCHGRDTSSAKLTFTKYHINRAQIKSPHFFSIPKIKVWLLCGYKIDIDVLGGSFPSILIPKFPVKLCCQRHLKPFCEIWGSSSFHTF